MSGTKHRRRRVGRVVLATLGVLAVGGGAMAATGLGLPNGDSNGPAKKSALPPATAPVHRQTLVDTQTESGSLAYAGSATVTGKSSGTVTWLPTAGATIDRGTALYGVDNAPVVLMYGTLPAYRTLTVDIEGDDVRQFEENLRALGYQGFTVDTEFTDATARAVKKWQKDLGLEQTGTVEASRIVYAAARIRVDTAKAAVGDSLQPGKELFTYTDTARVVTVELDMADQRLAKKDAAVTVALPNGKPASGRVTATRTTVSDSGDGGVTTGGGDSTETKIEVTVALDDPSALDGLDQASVDVAFTASQRENVLTVPVAALLALAEGGYGVQVVEGPVTRIVAVQTGMFARGRVEISGAGLAEGTIVGVPS